MTRQRVRCAASSDAKASFKRVAALSRFIGPCLLLHAACATDQTDEMGVQFVDVAEQAGIDFVHYNDAHGFYYYPETMGPGVAFFDSDGDGWLDVYLVNGAEIGRTRPDTTHQNSLFNNRQNGTFEDLTATSGAGDTGYGMGCTVGDVDNDGDQDLFVTNVGPNSLYLNLTANRFQNATHELRVGDPRWGASAGFLDYDRDGDLDLFVTNYVEWSVEGDIDCRRGELRSYCTPSYYEPEADILYRNDGQSFTDVTEEMGIALKGRGLGVAFSDYDQDGDTDIYVANDGDMNFLYENQPARFVESGLQAGVRFNQDGQAEAGMGVDFGDIDGDGNQELFVTNFAMETNTLYRQVDTTRYIDVTSSAGLNLPSFRPLGFGTTFLDFDNDADLDLFVANGHVIDNIARIDSGQTYRQHNQLFSNHDGRFLDVSSAAGASFSVTNVGRGTASGDYDNDGDVDLLVATVAGRPRLLRNDGGNRNNWLSIRLSSAGIGEVGTRITVITPGFRQTRERQSGGSYLSIGDARLHFGLAGEADCDIEVKWPNGESQRITMVQANQDFVVTRPGNKKEN